MKLLLSRFSPASSYGLGPAALALMLTLGAAGDAEAKSREVERAIALAGFNNAQVNAQAQQLTDLHQLVAAIQVTTTNNSAALAAITDDLAFAIAELEEQVAAVAALAAVLAVRSAETTGSISGTTGSIGGTSSVLSSIRTTINFPPVDPATGIGDAVAGGAADFEAGSGNVPEDLELTGISVDTGVSVPNNSPDQCPIDDGLVPVTTLVTQSADGTTALFRVPEAFTATVQTECLIPTHPIEPLVVVFSSEENLTPFECDAFPDCADGSDEYPVGIGVAGGF